MEKKLVILDEHKLLDISGKLFNFLEVVKFVAEFTEDAHYGNIMCHWANCLASISEDLDTLLDNTSTVSDEAALYLWRRMLETGKTQFSKTDINKLTSHSKLLPDMEKVEQALNVLKAAGQIVEMQISPNNHTKSVYMIVTP